MRRATIVLLLAVVLSLPILDATAAAKAAKRKIVATRTFTGPTTQVSRWGQLYVTIKVRKTTKEEAEELRERTPRLLKA